MTERRAISDIRVGQRLRRHLGNLRVLAASMAALGLLHPIVILPNGELVAGARRLAAAVLLGWTEIPVTVVNLEDVLRAEVDENIVRRDLTPSEAVAVHRALAGRLATPVGRPANGGNLPPLARGKTRDKVAHYVGMSGRTLANAIAVVEAAEADPAQQDLVDRMDRGGKVNSAYLELRLRQNRRLVEATTPIEEGLAGRRFRTIVIDPPWAPDAGVRGVPYATMTLPEIAGLPVRELAFPEGAHLYLWVTNQSMRAGFELLDGWGARYVTTITWCKTDHGGLHPALGQGGTFRGSTEHVLFATWGSLPLLVHDLGTWFAAPRGHGGHSSKPETFYEIVRRASPGPRLEMFARGPRSGFTVWGAEASGGPSTKPPVAIAGDSDRSVRAVDCAVTRRANRRSQPDLTNVLVPQ
ncbi:MAG TPA: MT-A70 family methyltransferase [Candidatus Limnocylindrales bacterium]|jgi:N6-adenosine-specific RNA methylase IME4